MTEGDIDKPITDGAELLGSETHGESPSSDVRSYVIDTLDAEKEAEKRGITIRQWKAVLHICEHSEDENDVNPDAFEYDGNGNITYPGSLILDNSAMTYLPENLKVKEVLSLIGSDISLLPDGLEVGKFIDLSGCDSLHLEQVLSFLVKKISSDKIMAASFGIMDNDYIKDRLGDLKTDKYGANIIYKDEGVLSDDPENYLLGVIADAKVLSERKEYDSDDSGTETLLDADIQERHEEEMIEEAELVPRDADDGEAED